MLVIITGPLWLRLSFYGIILVLTLFALLWRGNHKTAYVPNVSVPVPSRPIFGDIDDLFKRTRDDIRFASELCTTDVCKEAAKEILKNRDLSIDPCENFYDYACGGYKDNYVIPDGEDSWNQFDQTDSVTLQKVKGILEAGSKDTDIESLKSARKFYRTCLATRNNLNQNLQHLVDKLSVWGGWPLISDEWDEEKFDWQKAVVEQQRTSSSRDGSISPLFSMQVMRNPKNTSQFNVAVGPASPFLCSLFEETKDSDDVQQILRILKTFAERVTNYTKTKLPDHFGKDASDVMDFVRDFCEVLERNILRKSSDEVYQKLATLQTMSDKMYLAKNSPSTIDWKRLLRDYVHGSDAHLTLDDYTVIAPQILLNITELIDKTPSRTLANYILFFHSQWMSSYTSEDLISETTEVQANQCVKETRAVFPHAVGHEYAKMFFSAEEQSQAYEIVKHTLDSFIADLSQNKWMDDATRGAAIEKAKNMLPVVGYPDWYNHTSLIDSMYYEIKLGDSHVENMESAFLGDILFRAKLIPNVVARSITLKYGAAGNNAAYYPGDNVINIPAGILQAPFYVKGRPDALNFGSLVSIIGHEITHAFDLDGAKADKVGNAVNWWSDSSLENYFEKASCYAEQYKKPLIPELMLLPQNKIWNLNVNSTLNEDLADNGGLQAAFNAYTRHAKLKKKNNTSTVQRIPSTASTRNRLPGVAGLTPRQLFFLGFATNWCETSLPGSMLATVLTDEHSPPKYRTQFSLQNSEEFADAWKCSEKTTMNPKQKCELW